MKRSIGNLGFYVNSEAPYDDVSGVLVLNVLFDAVLDGDLDTPL